MIKEKNLDKSGIIFDGHEVLKYVDDKDFLKVKKPMAATTATTEMKPMIASRMLLCCVFADIAFELYTVNYDF